MRRPIATILALALLPALADAGGVGVRFEGKRFVGGTATWDELLGWAKAWHELERQRQRLMPALLRAREANLKTMGKPLGKPFDFVLRVAADRAWHQQGETVTTVRLGEAPLLLTLVPGRQRALKTDADFRREMLMRMQRPSPIVLTKVDGMHREIFGMPCDAYDVAGNGSGRVWLNTPQPPISGPLGAFAAAVTRDLGRLDGSLWFAAAKLGKVPVLAMVKGVKGMTLTGNELGGPLIFCYTRVAGDSAPADADVALPKGWAVESIPPR